MKEKLDEHFLNYDQSLAVKELGFDEPCLKMSEHRKLCSEQEKPDGCQLHNLHCGYPNCTIDKTITPVPLPLKSQFFKWVREKYGIDVHTSKNGEKAIILGGKHYVFFIETTSGINPSNTIFEDTYEQAEDACINKIIEIVNNQTK